MSRPVVYGIRNCDTVRKARAWFEAQGVEVLFHDFAKSGVPADRLPAWLAAAGWQRLLNRQGSTWRKLDPATQATASDAAGAAVLMAAQASVIKRPVVDWPDGRVSVGFDAAEFARHL